MNLEDAIELAIYRACLDVHDPGYFDRVNDLVIKIMELFDENLLDLRQRKGIS